MVAFKTLAVLALPLMAVATPLIARNDPPTSCNTGSVKCCKQTQTATDPVGSLLLALIGVDVSAAVDALIGVDCSPVTVIGTGHSSCSLNTVCCTGNTYQNNLVSLGCSPVNLSL